MNFPNTNRTAFVAFWAIVLVALLLFGITFVRVAELGSGPHPTLLFIRRIHDADVGLLGLLLGLGGTAFIGYVVFGAWTTCTLLVFLGLSCFDRDLVKHIWSPVIPGAEWESEFTRPQVKDVLWKAMVLTVISGAIGMLLLSFIL